MLKSQQQTKDYVDFLKDSQELIFKNPQMFIALYGEKMVKFGRKAILEIIERDDMQLLNAFLLIQNYHKLQPFLSIISDVVEMPSDIKTDLYKKLKEFVKEYKQIVKKITIYYLKSPDHLKINEKKLVLKLMFSEEGLGLNPNIFRGIFFKYVFICDDINIDDLVFLCDYSSKNYITKTIIVDNNVLNSYTVEQYEEITKTLSDKMGFHSSNQMVRIIDENRFVQNDIYIDDYVRECLKTEQGILDFNIQCLIDEKVFSKYSGTTLIIPHYYDNILDCRKYVLEGLIIDDYDVYDDSFLRKFFDGFDFRTVLTEFFRTRKVSLISTNNIEKIKKYLTEKDFYSMIDIMEERKILFAKPYQKWRDYERIQELKL